MAASKKASAAEITTLLNDASRYGSPEFVDVITDYFADPLSSEDDIDDEENSCEENCGNGELRVLAEGEHVFLVLFTFDITSRVLRFAIRLPLFTDKIVRTIYINSLLLTQALSLSLSLSLSLFFLFSFRCQGQTVLYHVFCRSLSIDCTMWWYHLKRCILSFSHLYVKCKHLHYCGYFLMHLPLTILCMSKLHSTNYSL